jgi:hypothetical protein
MDESILETVYSTAEDLHKAGLITDEVLERFGELGRMQQEVEDIHASALDHIHVDMVQTYMAEQQAEIERLTREEHAYRMEIGALKCALQEFVTSYDYWLSRRREDGKPLIDLGENARALLQGGKC